MTQDMPPVVIPINFDLKKSLDGVQKSLDSLAPRLQKSFDELSTHITKSLNSAISKGVSGKTALNTSPLLAKLNEVTKEANKLYEAYKKVSFASDSKTQVTNLNKIIDRYNYLSSITAKLNKDKDGETVATGKLINVMREEATALKTIAEEKVRTAALAEKAAKDEVVAQKAIAKAIKETAQAAAKPKKTSMTNADIMALPTRDITSIRLYSRAIGEATSAIYNMSKAENRNEAEIRQLTEALNQASKKLQKFKHDNDRSGASMEKNVGIIANWYNHFGRVALGFTVAYRAMNAFETGMRNTFNLIKEGIVLSGELTSLQAELATYYVLNTGNVNDFSEAMGKASANVQALAVASLQSVSTLDELSVGISELAQHNVLISPDNMKSFSAINDLLIQVAKATGDNAKQIRSEWGGLMDGQMKATNAFVRMLSSIGILDEQMIKSLKGTGDKAKIVEEIFKKTEAAALRLQETLMRTNPALGFEKWKSSFSVAIAKAVGDVSKELGTENIFGDILAKHISGLNKTLFGQDQEDIKQSMLAIAGGFDYALTVAEKFVVSLLKISAWASNNRETLTAIVKIFASYLILKEVTIAVTAAGKGFKTFIDTIKAAPSIIAGLRAALAGTIGMLTATTVSILAVSSAFNSLKDLYKIETYAGEKKKLEDLIALKEEANANANSDTKLGRAAISQRNTEIQESFGKLKKLKEEFQDIVNMSPTERILKNSTKLLDGAFDVTANFISKIGKVSNKEFEDFTKGFGDFLVLPPSKRKEIVESYEDTLKEIGDLTTNFFSKLEKAIADSDFAAFDKLLAPTTKELEIKLLETREEYEKLLVLAAATPEGLLKDKLDLKGLETAEKLKEIQEQYDGLADSMQDAQLAYFLEEDQKAATKWIEATLDNFQKLEIALAEINDAKKFMTEEQYLKALGKAGADSVESTKNTAKEIEDTWKHTKEKIQDITADFFSGAMKGEAKNFSEFAQSFGNAMVDITSQSLAKTFMDMDWGKAFKGIDEALGTGLGKVFSSLTDNVGIEIQNLVAVAATLYNTTKMTKVQGGISGGVAGAQAGGSTGNWYAAIAGGILGGAAGYMLGDNGPSYGERLSDAIEALIEVLQENTTKIADQILKTDALTLAQDNMQRSIFSTKMDGVNATLAGAFKIPEEMERRSTSAFDKAAAGIVNAVGTVLSYQTGGYSTVAAGAINTAIGTKDHGYTSSDYSKADTSKIISGLIFGDEFFKGLGVPDFITLMKQTSNDAGALIDKLVEVGYITAEIPERVLEYYSGGSSKANRIEKVADAIFETMLNGIMELAAGIDQMNVASEAFAKTWRDKDLTSKERDVQGWEETMNVFGGAAMQDYLAQVAATRDALLDTSAEALEKMDASELEDHFKNIAALDKVLTDSTDKLAEAEETRLLIEKHYYDAQVETTAAMRKDIAIATGALSWMEQTFLGIRETGEKYIDQLVDEGKNKTVATAMGEDYIKTLQKEAFQKQFNADIASYETRILQAKIDAATALGKTDELQILNQQLINKNRKEEIQGLIKTYKYGTPAFEAMHDLAKETWAFEDAARNAAAAMAGMWTKDSIATAKAGWISVIGSLGEIVTPKFFLDAIGLGRDSGLEHLLEATSGDEVKADYAELKELWRTGIIKEDQFNSILSEIIDNGAEVAEAISEAADKWKAMNDVGRESSKWYHGYIDEPLSDFAQAVKTAEDELEDFRVRIVEAGSSVAEGWEKGGYIEQAVTTAIRENFLTDLRQEVAEAFGPAKSSYMTSIDDITKQAETFITGIQEISLSQEEITAKIAETLNNRDADIQGVISSTNSWLTDIAGLNAPGVNMRESDRLAILNSYTEAYADALEKQPARLEAIKNAADATIESLKSLGFSAEELAEIQASVAEKIRLVNMDLLNKVRDTVYSITGDTDILLQQLIDLDADWMKVDAQDYGAQYDILTKQVDILTQLRDIQKDQLEETIANYTALQDVILELQGGSLAPVQSKEFFDLRYAQLLADAQSGDTTAVNALTNFINQYADFMGAYGDTNYKDFTASIINDLKTLQDKLTEGASISDLKDQLEDINNSLLSPLNINGMDTIVSRLDAIAQALKAEIENPTIDIDNGTQAPTTALDAITQAYKTLFDRLPDAEGFAFWTAQWEAGILNLSNLNRFLLDAAAPDDLNKAHELGFFASGGQHRGGWRWVGEKGPELEYTGPARITNHEDSIKLMSDMFEKTNKNPNIIVKVYVGNKELKDITVDTIKTSAEAQYQIKRVVNG